MLSFVLLTAMTATSGPFLAAPTCASGTCGAVAPTYGFAPAPAAYVPVQPAVAAPAQAAAPAPYYYYPAPAAPAYAYPQAAPVAQLAQAPRPFVPFYYSAGTCAGGSCARR